MFSFSLLNSRNISLEGPFYLNSKCMIFFIQAKVVTDSEMNYNYCVYDSDIATGYGVGAFLFLMASQVLIMVASRCFCFGKALNPSGSRACAVILFIICWYGIKNFTFDNFYLCLVTIAANM